MTLPPGFVACARNISFCLNLQGIFVFKTHVNGSLNTRLNAGAFVYSRDLADGLAVDGRGFDHVGDFLRVRELVFNRLRALHGNKHARVCKAMLHSKVDAVLLDIGNDDRLGIGGFADRRGEQADGAGANHQHRRAFRQVRSVAGVHGDGEGLKHGAEVERQGRRQSKQSASHIHILATNTGLPYL